jgi:hypothetical protein
MKPRRASSPNKANIKATKKHGSLLKIAIAVPALRLSVVRYSCFVGLIDDGLPARVRRQARQGRSK